MSRRFAFSVALFFFGLALLPGCASGPDYDSLIASAVCLHVLALAFLAWGVAGAGNRRVLGLAVSGAVVNLVFLLDLGLRYFFGARLLDGF